jgi:hypothetical protein
MSDRFNSQESRVSSLERRLLGVLLFLLGLFYAWIHFSRRLPRTHDSLYVYLVQNLFLAQSAKPDGLLLWFPYSTHGMLSNWYVACGGIFHTAMVLLSVPEGTNAVSLFHLGMLFEDLVLLVGTWRLSRWYHRTPQARFLVTAAVVASSFWGEQMWHNHRPAFAVPMILSFVHEFLEDGSRSKLFLAMNLLLLQFLGNVAYVAAMTHLIVGIYVVLYVLIFRRALAPRWPQLRPRPSDLLVVLPNLLMIGCIHYTLMSGADEIHINVVGRNPDGSVPLSDFLTYPGETGPTRYADLLLGTNPSMDYTIFCGIASVPLALLALAARPGRKTLHLSLYFMLVLLLSFGYLSGVGLPAYLLPPMRYYRYIALVALHLRLPLIFLAGLGLDALLGAGRRNPTVARRFALGLGAQGVLCALLGLAFSYGSNESLDLIRTLTTPRPGLANYNGLTKAVLLQTFGSAALAALAAAATAWLLPTRPRSGRLIATALLAILVADLARWRVSITLERGVSLTSREYELQKTTALPYLPRRNGEPADPARLLEFVAPTRCEDGGSRYDTSENYLQRDPPASVFFASHWMGPVHELVRAYADQGTGGALGPTPSVWRVPAGLTLRAPYDKIIGQTVDKLQVFAAAHGVPDDREAAAAINRPGYSGDVLFVAPTPGAATGPLPEPRSNERVDAEVRVLSFDANHLRAKVELPRGRSAAWLLYCDAWHSQWSATVNGRSVPVARAFLAYKAVPLEEGTSEVEFRMKAPRRVWTFRVAAAASALWVLGIVPLTLLSLGWNAFAVRRRAAGPGAPPPSN